MDNYDIRPIGKRVSQWGEGPIWWNDKLYYVDIEGHAVVELDSDSGHERTWNLGERVGTIVPMLDNQWIYAGDSGIYAIDLPSGQKKLLADPEVALRSTNRFNDGKCDPAGRFWVGSISLIKATGSANLYSLDTEGALSLQQAGLTNSNGICWSLDHRKLYHIDTPTKQICVHQYSIESGQIGKRELCIDTAAYGFDSSPDGMTIDSAGRLWVAFCHGACVACFDPNARDALVERIEIPCVETTACCFGGPDLDRLFVTTGQHKTLHENAAGRVFVIDGLSARGLPTYPYRGSIA
jgi:sugar lactone lactonase YvrE